jgi:hypothetical protein
MKNFSQYSRSLDRDLNPCPPEYEAKVLTTRPFRSMKKKLDTKYVINGEISLDNYFSLFQKSHTELSRKPSQQLVSPKCLSVARNGIRRNVPLGEAMPTKLVNCIIL